MDISLAPTLSAGQREDHGLNHQILTSDQRPDMSDVVWSDPDWLQYFGLTVHTALDYFSRSSFYDFGCNNEVIRQRGLDLTKLA